MATVVEQIQNLSREQAFEAVQYLSDEIPEMNVDADDTIAEATALAPLTAQPYQNLDDLEHLARATLVAASFIPEYNQAVQNAIDGVGKKQFILGGAEIVVLSVVALAALQVILKRPNVTKKTSIIETDGKYEINVEETVSYNISSSLGGILDSFFKGKLNS